MVILDRIRLIGRLFFDDLDMQYLSSKGLKVGLGTRGIVGAIVLGFICLYQPLFRESSSFLWAKILLILAAIVYVAFSLLWDRKFIKLTNFQLIGALLLLGASGLSGEILIVALGLLLHAIWDLWHLATEKRYVPWWYAGACVYVDLAAVLLIFLTSK